MRKVLKICHTDMKICFKCNQEKPLGEFSKHSGMADGHLGKCKSCANKDGQYYYYKNRENSKWRESEKARAREKYHRLDYKNRHRPTTEQKRIVLNKHFNKFPERLITARHSQHMFVPKGCHKHHWSYNEEHWKDIIILTLKDHNLLHRVIIYDQSVFMFRNAVGEILNTKQSHLDVLACAKLSEKTKNKEEYYENSNSNNKCFSTS